MTKKITNFEQYISGLKAEDFASFVECGFCPTRKACKESDAINDHCWDIFLRWANKEADIG